MSEKVAHECVYGKAEYTPHSQITTHLVKETRVFAFSHTITVARTAQWPKALQELRHRPVSDHSQLAFQLREMPRKIHSAADECYVKMLGNFEKFYESFPGQIFETVKMLSQQKESVSALIECLYKDLLNNAADSLAERLSDAQAPAELALEITMEVKDGRFNLLVKDEGVGLTAERVAAVNTNSYASDKTGKIWVLGSTGKGLKNARRQVTTCGGTLEVRSEGINRGATVVLCLPLC